MRDNWNIRLPILGIIHVSANPKNVTKLQFTFGSQRFGNIRQNWIEAYNITIYPRQTFTRGTS